VAGRPRGPGRFLFAVPVENPGAGQEISSSGSSVGWPYRVASNHQRAGLGVSRETTTRRKTMMIKNTFAETASSKPTRWNSEFQRVYSLNASCRKQVRHRRGNGLRTAH
jgi:hypothetical protein